MDYSFSIQLIGGIANLDLPNKDEEMYLIWKAPE